MRTCKGDSRAALQRCGVRPVRWVCNRSCSIMEFVASPWRTDRSVPVPPWQTVDMDSETLRKRDVCKPGSRARLSKAKDLGLVLEPTCRRLASGARLRKARICYTGGKTEAGGYLRSEVRRPHLERRKSCDPRDPRISAVDSEISLDLPELLVSGRAISSSIFLVRTMCTRASLSRFYLPGALSKLPEERAGAERKVPPKRREAVVGDPPGRAATKKTARVQQSRASRKVVSDGAK